jgi:UDP-N-acetylglucosamine acyltransferase
VIRECATLNRGTAKDEGVTRIGSDNLFMAYAHVAHDCLVGNQCVLANNGTLGGHVQLGDWVIMGGLSAIHQFCKVGAHAFIANNAAVTRDVPPYVMAVGQPASAHSVNAEGLKRRGFTTEQIRNIRNAFRVLYRSGLKLVDATKELEGLAKEQPEIQPIVEFLRLSTRSILR